MMNVFFDTPSSYLKYISNIYMDDIVTLGALNYFRY